MTKISAVRTAGLGSLIGVIMSAGCLERSLSPLFLPEDSVFDERLLGEWGCGDESWTFSRQSDKDWGSKEFYQIEVHSHGKNGRLAAWLGRLDDDLFITFAPMVEIDLPNSFFERHILEVFTFGRATVEPNRLRLAMLDSAWFEKAHTAGVLPLGVDRRLPGRGIDDLDIILTAQPNELQRFARAYAHDDSVFGEHLEFVRRMSAESATPDASAPTGGHCYSDGK